MNDFTTSQYSQTNLIDALNQIEALTTIAMSVDITEVKPEIAMNYLWVITEITQKARNIADKIFEKIPKDN